MGVYQDVFDQLKNFEISSIDGQPTDEDINKLTTQLTAALVTIETENGGGKLGHIGIVVPEHRYITLSGGVKFTEPIRPAPYPASVSNDAAIREKQVAEHKAEIVEFDTYKACTAWARQTIVNAVDDEWISELKDEDLGYQLAEPLDLLEHLRDAGGDLDDMEITDLNTNMLAPWDGVEAPVTMFARGDQYERQLDRFGIPKQPEIRLSYGVATFQTSGQFDPAMREWNARPLNERTFTKFRTFIQNEYTKQVKRNRSTAGSVGKGIANKATEEPKHEQRISDAEAQALVIAEVANVLATQNQEQMKQMMGMFKEMLTSFQPAAAPAPSPAAPTRQTLKPCPHCKRRHATPDKCWELEKNAASRPANWKPSKST